MSNSLSSNIIFRDQCRHHLCSINAPWAVESFDVSFVPIFSLIDGVCHFQISLLANNHHNSWKFTQNILLWLYWSFFECFFDQMSTDRFLGSIMVILSFISEMKKIFGFFNYEKAMMTNQKYYSKVMTSYIYYECDLRIICSILMGHTWWYLGSLDFLEQLDCFS